MYDTITEVSGCGTGVPLPHKNDFGRTAEHRVLPTAPDLSTAEHGSEYWRFSRGGSGDGGSFAASISSIAFPAVQQIRKGKTVVITNL